MTIKVGDTVQWWEPFKNTHKKNLPRMITGVALSVHAYGKKPWAGVKVEGTKFPGGNWVRQLSVLSVVESRPGPIEAVVDAEDYEQLRVIGDLGGVELG